MFYQFNEDLRYAYSVGELKVRENRLLTQRDFGHIYSTTNFEEILTILSEAGYQTPERTEEFFLNIEHFLTLNLGLLYSAIKDLSYHQEITELFIICYDFRNFGVLLKRKLTGEDINKIPPEEGVLVNLGLHGLEKLKEAFVKKNYELYPDKVAEIFLKIEGETNIGNVEQINQILDKEYFNFALEVSSANDFCYYIFRILIDFINIKNVLRFKRIKKDISLFEQCYIAGGLILKSDFVNLFNGSLSLDNLLFRYSYQKMVSPIAEGSLEILEKKLDDFFMGILKETKFSFIGLESIIAYLLVKELEVKNLRLILRGKTAGLTEKEVIPYLREIYV